MELVLAMIAGLYLTSLFLLLAHDDEYQGWIDATAMMASAIVGLAMMLVWGVEDMSSFLIGYATGIVLGWVFRKHVFDLDHYEILE